MKESAIYLQLAKYLSLQYPKIIFHFDTGSGFSMSIGAAVQQKRINPIRGYPDLFIAEPRNGSAGLFIEIKKESILKKNGELKAGEHLLEQFNMLNVLRTKGYECHFGIGFEDCKKIIDNYLK